jgi:hypothetical protein
MIRKFEAAKNSLHLLIAPVHPDRKLGDPHIHFGEPDFHVSHAGLEIAYSASDFADVVFQVRDIRLNAPKDLKNKLVSWLGHSLS